MQFALFPRFRAVILLLAAIACVVTPRAFAADGRPPEKLNYQGFLIDGNGNPLATNTPGNYDVTFRIWNSAEGGTLLWSEKQTVTVDKGNFSVLLGDGTAVVSEPSTNLSSLFMAADASDRYIGITVTVGVTPVDILPRLRLVTSSYAFLARHANDLVDSTGAVLNLAQLDKPQNFSGNNTFSGPLNFTAAVSLTSATWGSGGTSGLLGDGSVRLADHPVYLRGGADTGHQLVYVPTTDTFGDPVSDPFFIPGGGGFGGFFIPGNDAYFKYGHHPIDGPALYGNQGGLLGTSGNSHKTLIWTQSAVGINCYPTHPFVVNNGAYTDGSQWLNSSDKNIKENFATVDKLSILGKLESLSVQTWTYISDTNHSTHLGPTAQDFKAAFGLGNDDKAIGVLDEAGVALASIQGLHQIVKQQQADIDQLKKTVAELQKLLQSAGSTGK
jgi:Chaperone of endosialidase